MMSFVCVCSNFHCMFTFALELSYSHTYFAVLKLGLFDLWISLQQNFSSSFVGTFFPWYYRVFASFRIWIHYHVIWMQRNMFSLFIFALKGVAFTCCCWFFSSLSSDERINKNTRKTPQSFFSILFLGYEMCVQSFFSSYFCFFLFLYHFF